MKLLNRVSSAGPVLTYLNELAAISPEHQTMAKKARDAVRRVFMTDDGAILMDLLEKSTELFFLPPSADPRALDALNAQRFIPLDLKRIASDDGNPDPGPRKPTLPR